MKDRVGLSSVISILECAVWMQFGRILKYWALASEMHSHLPQIPFSLEPVVRLHTGQILVPRHSWPMLFLQIPCCLFGLSYQGLRNHAVPITCAQGDSLVQKIHRLPCFTAKCTDKWLVASALPFPLIPSTHNAYRMKLGSTFNVCHEADCWIKIQSVEEDSTWCLVRWSRATIHFN